MIKIALPNGKYLSLRKNADFILGKRRKPVTEKEIEKMVKGTVGRIKLEKKKVPGIAQFVHKEKKIIYSPKTTPEIFAHELGHVERFKGKAGKKREWIRRAGGALSVGGLLGGMFARTRKGRVAALGGYLAGYSPVPYEEYMATKGAKKTLKQLRIRPKEQKKQKKTLRRAFGSYFAIPAAITATQLPGIISSKIPNIGTIIRTLK